MQDTQNSSGYLFHKLSLSLLPSLYIYPAIPCSGISVAWCFSNELRNNWCENCSGFRCGWLMRPQGLAGAEVVQVHSINSLASHFSSVSVRKLIFIINRDTILLQKHRGVHVRWFITIVANKWGWELTFAPHHQATALNSFEIRPFGALVIVQLLVATTTLIL